MQCAVKILLIYCIYKRYIFIGLNKMMIRVRFAPSPTGLLHIGNARAAVLPWLFAKKNNGEFMLRLDDTDQERSTKEFADAIIEDMQWLGLDYQHFAKQSDRFDRYKAIMDDLIAKGRLYPCYETPEELDFKRKRQLAKGEPPIYDRSALNLSKEDIEKFEKEGRRPHWRFKLTPSHIVWNDLIRGSVSFDANRLSDPVLIRADGIYLYTLASVVDDIDFNISHIVRGEDHVTNTAIQIQLFEAITGTPCQVTFAHFTLFMDKNGQALSKRLGSLSLQSMRENGLSPMAINSLLARLGTSLPVEPALHLSTLADQFDFNIFSRTPPHFDEHDLEILNHKIMTMTPYADIKNKLPETVTESIWNLVKGNLESFDAIEKWRQVFDPSTNIPKHEENDYIKLALDHFPDAETDINTWQLWTQKLKEATDRKGKALFMPLRQVLTGFDHGPEMKEILPLLGRDIIINRLKKAAGQ